MWASARCCTVLLLSAAAYGSPVWAEPVKATLPWGADKAQQVPETPIQTLARVEKYLNEQQTITADFKQQSPDGGFAEGKMYVERPGKIRWEYAPPMPVLMVGDGKNFIYYDSELNQISYLPVDRSLAAFLTRKNISFEDSALRVINFREGAGFIRFTILQAAHPEDGRLMLEFSDNPLKLVGMEIVDGAEQTTRISLANQVYNEKLDPKLFVFEEPKKDGREMRRYRK